ncbi:hypothetical protein ACFY0N_39035 [Streptomyces vinaceus]|uniref:hypothetical protein n=1 Tax=Streptomyces vinaceus TaxID=1960 RepID=UPI0035D6E4AA
MAAYFGHLLEKGKPDGSKYSPDSPLAYCDRIASWHPKRDQPNGSLIREMIQD